jgi:small-conductance mechanosensitive channel
VPNWLKFIAHFHDLLWSLSGVGLALVLGALAHRAIFGVLERLKPRLPPGLVDSLMRRTRSPARIVLPLLAVSMMMPSLPVDSQIFLFWERLVGMAVICLIGWLCLIGLVVIEDVVGLRYDVKAEDNWRARQVNTQGQMLRRVASVVVVVLTVGFMLMTFPAIRRLGLSLFASAGLAGLVVGIAARPALSNVIAGLQLAFTELIRIDDVVIVQGEYGWIEEIATSYVVVRVWDQRRLVVPLSYFIEQPF